MGTGKTTIGKIIADRLNLCFFEIDEEIEKQEKQTINEIFSTKGEQYFRKLETEALKKISEKENFVVSCGGGLICNKNNLKILKETGKIFNLSASSATIYERIKNERNRPLLNVANPLEKIEQLMKKRTPYYKESDYEINTESMLPKEVANKIIEILNG